MSVFHDPKHIQLLNSQAEDGSKTAERVVKLLKNCVRLSEMVEQETEKPFYKDSDSSELIDIVYESVTLPYDELILTSDHLSKITTSTCQGFRASRKISRPR